MITKTLLTAIRDHAVLTLSQLFHDNGVSFNEPGEMNFVVSLKSDHAAIGAFEAKFEYQNEASRCFRNMFKKYYFDSVEMDPEYYLYLTMDWSEEEEEEHYYDYFC